MTKPKPRVARICLPTDLAAVRGGEDKPKPPEVKYYDVKLVEVLVTSTSH